MMDHAYINGSRPTNSSRPTIYLSADKTFALAMLILGFLYWNLIKPNSMGAGVSIFAVLLMAVTWVYLKGSDNFQPKSNAFWAGVLLISVFSFSIFDNITLKALNFIFISALFIYWVAASTGNRLDGALSSYLPGDLLKQSLIVPFTNLSCCFGALKNSDQGSRQWKSMLAAVIGIVAFLPVLILVISLLVNADAAFESMTEKIRFSISEDVIEYILQMILGIPVACYLYGLVYGNRYGRNTDRFTKESVDKTNAGLRFAPKITVCSALTMLNLIYAVFFIVAAPYFFSAFMNDLPGAMTYAEYARRGFFELCAVAAINLAVTAVAYMITARAQMEEQNKVPKALRIEVAVLCGFTIMLILTALRKMALYIHYYGLTQLRVYTTWFMLVLLVIFIMVAIRQFKFYHSARMIIAACVVGFLLLTYGNADGFIAKYNIERYSSGTLETIDTEALAELSDAAAPYIYELYLNTEDTVLKDQLKTALMAGKYAGAEDSYGHRSFRDFNLQRYKAEQIRAAIS